MSRSYNETLWGPSGNITVNGTLTCNLDTLQQSTVTRRGLGAGSEPNVDLLNPPYAIHNGQPTNFRHCYGELIWFHRQRSTLSKYTTDKRHTFRWAGRAGRTQHVGNDGGEDYASCRARCHPRKTSLHYCSVYLSVIGALERTLGMS